MKIILTQDVKGKGKKGQYIEVASGFANFLVKNKKALIANDKNVEMLDKQREDAKNKEEALIKEMTEVKKIVESHPVKVRVKTSESGRIFGSVSTKQVCDIFLNETQIKLDKKKIKTNITINSLGVYKLEIELHKKVYATLSVQVEAL